MYNLVHFTEKKLAGIDPKGLFTWTEGAPANQATQLEGLK